ncbi:hypothetical protein D3Y59_00760 [Hymenobacter oligotrophus]|uniref:Uncharacterized protein n=1 Tax=Hymenobacter oligotrophus TaxID=2319843 RepID=A0A3B7QX81_9BACT|nr:hypothetical protein D3Y59_00760 [Hymenobacter oligotrophus]
MLRTCRHACVAHLGRRFWPQGQRSSGLALGNAWVVWALGGQLGTSQAATDFGPRITARTART